MNTFVGVGWPIVASVFVFCSLIARGQVGSPEQTKSTGPVSVVKTGSGIIAPAMKQVDFSPAIATQCERRFHGKVTLSLVVDAQGNAQNMLFLVPAVNDLDRLAILVAQMDRFTPAIQAGAPVAIGQQLELSLEACVISRTDNSGRTVHSLRLGSVPEQKFKSYDGYPSEVVFATERLPGNPRTLPLDHFHKVGGNISPPFPINSPDAEFSDEGRRKNISGVCVVSLFVDAYGMPHDPVIEHSLEPSMDQKALEAASRYRFKPAMRNKLEPVPVRIEIEVNFKLTGRGEPF
jgi:TonB family protein